MVSPAGIGVPSLGAETFGDVGSSTSARAGAGLANMPSSFVHKRRITCDRLQSPPLPVGFDGRMQLLVKRRPIQRAQEEQSPRAPEQIP
ncbi:hypothetical protein N185_02165 [Sinorhizobium sp. GW3]|nr:hypothetical protein N185_02165 [Sinorhizobium sp. GW3]OKP67396.1 hypothetical protein BTE77_30495 [Ensifer adhaerens]